MKHVRVNVRSVANVKKARQEQRNGRSVWVVPSATLPDNVVMNGIKYPADEISKSFISLNRTPAPLGHPLVNGRFISASDPEGINLGYIGAWNENARREGGRVLLDKIVDIEVANRSEGGKAVLEAINAGQPVHTSTGLFCNLEVSNDGDSEYIARNIEFDHDAILLNEQGAATPEQGVGMFVNSAGVAEEIEVINSAIEWADRDLDWAMSSMFDALERRERVGLVDRLKSAIIEAFTPLRNNPKPVEENTMADEKQLEELSAKVNALSETVNTLVSSLPETISNAVKPLTDNLAEIQANQKAQEEAEKAGLIQKIVKANLLDEDAASELTLNAARKLAEKAKPASAAGLNGAFVPNGADDEFAGYDMNAHAVKEVQ